ncbi:DUF983 domain-containing protein [Fulvivirga sediminis]|uniref:DUF983 domain-containing protein n=1 Tax=Fulvivirga sediminis TaxID=2803949 RepID=A0A937F422_9BACT|nr:DUF983 domain-containing protein [Fulvivirga sediminis]MBL3655967.1 DUF983 domain-containing protein [Fulvivirga sediminis]
MKELSALEAVAAGKCPRCRKGKMFKYPAYNLTKFTEMNEECEHCHLKFEREPGFFIGAMYVSYAFSVALFVTVGVGLSVLGDFSLTTYVLSTTASVLLLLPILFRYSRIIFLHAFGGVKYQPDVLATNDKSS